MSRYIDADKIIYTWLIDNDGKEHDGVTLQSVIDMMPTADVRENVRGEWIRRDSRYVGWISFDCSVCGETLELDRETSNDFKYCPFCGADMRNSKLQYGDEDTLQGGLMSAT